MPIEIIAEGVAPDAAIEFWRQRAKLTWDEARGLAAGARQRAFYVTGLARKDLVELVSEAIQAALENGETLEDFKKRILQAIHAQGWHSHRVENIFRTNMQSAYAAGRYKKMQAVSKYRPYWQYLAVMDKRTRPSHAALHEKVYPADHEFWDTNYPPNGFRCRCAVATLSARQVKSQNLAVETKMPSATMWTDPKTGMEHFVNFPGADNGFRNNPFKDWASKGGIESLPGLSGWNYKKLRQPTYEQRLRELAYLAKKPNPAGHKTNCTRCYGAIVRILRGDEVVALPNPYPDRNGTSRRKTFSGKECFATYPLVYGNGERGGKLKNHKELLSSMNFLPDGARVGIYWIEADIGQGHIIAAEKVDGRMVFIDPQNGIVGPKALGNADKYNGYFWFREDNLELDNEFEWDEVIKKV